MLWDSGREEGVRISHQCQIVRDLKLTQRLSIHSDVNCPIWHPIIEPTDSDSLIELYASYYATIHKGVIHQRRPSKIPPPLSNIIRLEEPPPSFTDVRMCRA